MTAKANQLDEKWMRLALHHARRGIGRTAPNPPVGCVIIKDNEIVGHAHTADQGRPHAEAIALEMAGQNARGASAYVTLEPCSHHGQTAPCARALVEAGIQKVFIGTKDQAPHVNGAGISYLQNHGLDVYTGLCESQCIDLAQGFFLSQLENRPLVTLKMASTLDGKIATKSGESQWITSSHARRRSHLERSMHDAIMVGIQTVLDDDPDLTSRITGYSHKIIRCVMDSTLRISPDSKLVQSAKDKPLWVFHQSGEESRQQRLTQLGVRVIKVKDTRNLKIVMAELAQQDITRLLVEGGARLTASFIQQNLVDRLLWFRAPLIIGHEGRQSVQGEVLDKLSNALRFKKQESQSLGQDMLEIYQKAE